MREYSIPERFEEMVASFPDRLAVKCTDLSWSYEELNQASNRLARSLLTVEQLRNGSVALLFDHDVNVIVAIMGALKAGKQACVLDSRAPETRMKSILDNCQSSLILTDKGWRALAEEVACNYRKVLNIDQIDQAVSPANLGLQIAPNRTALIAYTSGSTGQARSVAKSHQESVARAISSGRSRKLCADDRLSLLHSVAFGSGLADLFMALLNGVTVLPFDIASEGIRNFVQWLKREQITIFHAPPTVFRELENVEILADQFTDVRLIRLSGGPITKREFELYKKKFGRDTLMEVGMGSTEVEGISKAVVSHDFIFPKEGSPIGYARKGRELLILDDDGHELPAGEVGEIAVRSRQFTEDYWRQRGLSEVNFRRDPKKADEWVYLTGDVGTRSADGFFIHLGRKDFMVKVRGYRVNIGEVETALLEHPDIKDAGVRAWEREPGEKYLAGYVVSRQESQLSLNSVREFLGSKLPDYMVPSVFKFMEALPLTNGKLDRLALPRPTNQRPELKEPYLGPRSEIEGTLVRLWSEVLLIDQVGVDDNFFDLGGHSLAGARIITRVKEEFGVELTVSDLLETPMVAKMAECISLRQSGGTKAKPRKAEPMGDRALTLEEADGQLSIGFPPEEVEQSIPERFEKIVRNYPSHPAVESENETLAYADLNAQSNRMARAILKRAECNVHPVALLFGKGSAQVIAMLAVLKAGKFFVLLDPALPEDRLSAILEDTGSELLLHDQKNAALATRLSRDGCQLLQASLASDDGSTENLGRRIAPDDLAYVVYTSGSTGKPKGVIQNHQNILHRTMLRVRTDHLRPNDRFAHITSGTSNEITNAFYSLLNGASMVIFDLRKEGVDRLAQWLVQERITLCSFATPLFRKLCETLTGTVQFPHLRSIRFRSDAIFKSDVELYEKFFPKHCILVTSLSSTETGALTETVIPKASEIPGNEVSIGCPQPDKEIVLLDDNGHQVEVNLVGEIVVRSKYLSPGYWRRPDLTAAKFKQDPDDPEKCRCYHTGDLALMLPNGCLVHKGRKDFRVKIRGYGVELAEVEKTLRGHNEVTDCVVVDRKDESGETKLIAYFSSAGQLKPNASELRRHLSGSLPGYMVPSAFVRLESIPLLPNGKVDRRALPEPDTTRPELSVPYEAPRTRLERDLAEFWAEVLSLDRVGTRDDFFDLGGHSLSGSLIISWIHEKFGVDLPVSEFFVNPTVAQLAERIEGAARETQLVGKKTWTYLCELQKGKGRPPIFIFPGGGGGEPEFFVYGFLARHVGAEYPFYGLRARGADGVLQPHTSVPQMADAYVEEIRSLQPKGPYFLVGECAGGVNAYEAARQLVAQSQQVAMLVLMDVERPTFIKYLQFRMNRWLEPVNEIFDDTVFRWWRQNYYLARIPHHLRQLRSIALREYPNYIAGQVTHTLNSPEKKPRLNDSRRERAEIVLYTTASGDAFRHIEWIRENYRRTVRRFRPRSYDGPIEVLVSEKLCRHDPTLGWKHLALKGLSIHPVPGDHWSYIRDHVDVVGPKLRECLERAERNAVS